LALLKIKANKALPYISFGDSDKARVGDWVIAVGNPFGFGNSFTAGIISARGRDIQSGPYDDFIQIDAPINKGNSGGPLLNMSGEVIGINTAIYSPNGGNVGIGFAVPSVMAASIINQLEQHGSVERGWLGVQIQSISKDIANSLGLQQVSGALVAEVLADTPAKKAGILPGDVIIEVNGKSVENAKALSNLIANMAAGESVELGIWRLGSKQTVKVILGRMSNEIGGEQGSVELGLTLDEITAQRRKQYQLSADVKGVVIVEVKEGSPAAEKGLKSGDVIMMVNQEKVSTPLALVEKVKQAASAKRKTVLLLVNRQGRQYFVMVKI
jgi:serine protease Do